MRPRLPFANRRSQVRRGSLFALATVGVFLAAGTGRAQLERHADPGRDLAVTPAAGAYLISVTSFSGPQGAELANGLCLEVRQKYRMNAYVFNRGEDEQRKYRQEMEERRQRMAEALRQRGLEGDVPLRMPRMRIEPEYGVLVGGYKDMAAARRALDGVRKLKPPSEVYMQHAMQVDSSGKQLVKEYINPFQKTSFVVPNPTIPREHEDANKPDPFLKELNAGEEFSLLKSKKPWTLVVKVFHGRSTIQSPSSSGSFLNKIGLGRNSADVLTASGMMAHQLAEGLRTGKNKEFCLGHDAYVLHMRNCSLVTVGSFDRKDDPQLLQLQRVLANCKLMPQDPRVAVDPLSGNPQPYEVPRP